MSKGGSADVTTTWPSWLSDAVRPLMQDTIARYRATQGGLWDMFMPGVDPEYPEGRDDIDFDPNTPDRPLNSKSGKPTGPAADRLSVPQGALVNSPMEFPNGGVPDDPTGAWWMSGDDLFSGSADGILGDNSRTVIGAGPLADMAARLSTTVGDSPAEFAQAKELLAGLGDIASEKVTGESIDGDPAIQAAQDRFDSAILPLIESQSALSGLNRSTALTNASSAQKAQTMLPMIQDAIGREERGIDRRLSTQGNRIQGLMGLGDRTQKRKRDAITDLMGMESYGRGIRQDQSDSRYDDWARKASMFENYLAGPFGMTPTTQGTHTERDKK